MSKRSVPFECYDLFDSCQECPVSTSGFPRGWAYAGFFLWVASGSGDTLWTGEEGPPCPLESLGYPGMVTSADVVFLNVSNRDCEARCPENSSSSLLVPGRSLLTATATCPLV